MSSGGILATRMNFRRTMAATAILVALALNTASAADTAYFKDVRMPNGHARDMAAKLADGAACGASADRSIGNMPAFEKCMGAHGWALDHFGPGASGPVQNTAVHFVDMSEGQRRSDAALQTDTTACDGGGKTDVESASFKQCMLGRGWQFTFTQHAPAPAPGPSWSSGWAWSNSPSFGANNDDFVRGNDDSNRSNQAISDAINAASQATADSDAAAAAQAQLDSIQVSAPIPAN
jgi:hypothetical protein